MSDILKIFDIRQLTCRLIRHKSKEESNFRTKHNYVRTADTIGLSQINATSGVDGSPF
jgi:hypothetical protein